MEERGVEEGRRNNNEGRTYQACKLDPGVNRLRLSVPHGVNQPDCRPTGPRRRSFPAGVGL